MGRPLTSLVMRGLPNLEARELQKTSRENPSRASSSQEEWQEEDGRLHHAMEKKKSIVPSQLQDPKQFRPSLLNNNQHNTDRRRSRQRTPSSLPSFASHPQVAGALTIISSFLYLCVLWATESFLDGLSQENSVTRMTTTTTTTLTSEGLLHFKNDAPELPIQPLSSDRSTDEENTPVLVYDRYIVFQDYAKTTQGQGNIMSGLLAAHLLGLEFHRTVCVDPQWTSFHQAFAVTDPAVAAACRQVLASMQEKDASQQQQKPPIIRLVNFGTPPNECHLQTLLASPDVPLVVLYGNTYPRWPRNALPQGLWQALYRPTAALQASLPPPPLPHTVVHLRHGDHAKDARPGLDADTLQALHQLLLEDEDSQRDVFLVTNQVDVYYPLADAFGWKHPPWHSVVHSVAATAHHDDDNDTTASNKNNLQLWADWYVLTQARTIYHTPSDFSASAVHWNINTASVTSFQILGMEEPQSQNATVRHLMLRPEVWLEEAETLPLVDRRGDDLWHCEIHGKPARHAAVVHKRRAVS